MTITLYSKPNCGPCMATGRALDKMKVTYDEQSGPDNVELLHSLGHSQAPVVVVRDGDRVVDHWSGFRPDKIEEWAA